MSKSAYSTIRELAHQELVCNVCFLVTYRRAYGGVCLVLCPRPSLCPGAFALSNRSGWTGDLLYKGIHENAVRSHATGTVLRPLHLDDQYNSSNDTELATTNVFHLQNISRFASTWCGFCRYGSSIQYVQRSPSTGLD